MKTIIAITLAVVLGTASLNAQTTPQSSHDDPQMALCELMLGLVIVGCVGAAGITIIKMCQKCCTHELVLCTSNKPNGPWTPTATNYINPCTITNPFVVFQDIMWTNMAVYYKVKDNGCVTNEPNQFAVSVTQ